MHWHTARKTLSRDHQGLYIQRKLPQESVWQVFGSIRGKMSALTFWKSTFQLKFSIFHKYKRKKIAPALDYHLWILKATKAMPLACPIASLILKFSIETLGQVCIAIFHHVYLWCRCDASSPYIRPVGYCQETGSALTTPAGRLKAHHFQSQWKYLQGILILSCYEAYFSHTEEVLLTFTACSTNIFRNYVSQPNSESLEYWTEFDYSKLSRGFSRNGLTKVFIIQGECGTWIFSSKEQDKEQLTFSIKFFRFPGTVCLEV